MFDVLMFLFENYMQESIVLQNDSHSILHELEGVGFERFEIECALDWLAGLVELQDTLAHAPQLTPQAIRYYLPDECARLSPECRSLLLQLERHGILDPATREIVIDRLMVLEVPEIDLQRVRWVALMALFNQPERKAALLMLQDIVLASAHKVLQ
jgi:Smg protein